MALAGGLGLCLDLDRVPLAADIEHDLITLFSESNGRWLVEVTPENATAFESLMEDCPLARCGELTANPVLTIGPIQLEVGKLDAAWQGQAIS